MGWDGQDGVGRWLTLDPEKTLPKAAGVIGYPLLVIADAKTKKVLYVHTGYSEEMRSQLEPVIQRGLK